jgi:hypothetical protein
MTTGYHWIDDLHFARGVLTARVTSLHTGEPDGLIGLPLTKTSDSRSWQVTCRNVGRFRVLGETWNQLKDPYEEIAGFVYRQLKSPYLAENIDSATICAADVPQGTKVEHYVLYGANYVVDLLGGALPEVQPIEAITDFTVTGSRGLDSGA